MNIKKNSWNVILGIMLIFLWGCNSNLGTSSTSTYVTTDYLIENLTNSFLLNDANYGTTIYYTEYFQFNFESPRSYALTLLGQDDFEYKIYNEEYDLIYSKTSINNEDNSYVLDSISSTYYLSITNLSNSGNYITIETKKNDTLDHISTIEGEAQEINVDLNDPFYEKAYTFMPKHEGDYNFVINSSEDISIQIYSKDMTLLSSSQSNETTKVNLLSTSSYVILLSANTNISFTLKIHYVYDFSDAELLSINETNPITASNTSEFHSYQIDTTSINDGFYKMSLEDYAEVSIYDSSGILISSRSSYIDDITYLDFYMSSGDIYYLIAKSNTNQSFIDMRITNNYPSNLSTNNNITLNSYYSYLYKLNLDIERKYLLDFFWESDYSIDFYDEKGQILDSSLYLSEEHSYSITSDADGVIYILISGNNGIFGEFHFQKESAFGEVGLITYKETTRINITEPGEKVYLKFDSPFSVLDYQLISSLPYETTFMIYNDDKEVIVDGLSYTNQYGVFEYYSDSYISNSFVIELFFKDPLQTGSFSVSYNSIDYYEDEDVYNLSVNQPLSINTTLPNQPIPINFTPRFTGNHTTNVSYSGTSTSLRVYLYSSKENDVRVYHLKNDEIGLFNITLSENLLYSASPFAPTGGSSTVISIHNPGDVKYKYLDVETTGNYRFYTYSSQNYATTYLRIYDENMNLLHTANNISSTKDFDITIAAYQGQRLIFAIACVDPLATKHGGTSIQSIAP